MTKVFCDHCHKEITNDKQNELTSEDCFWDIKTRNFVGSGCVLCEECWEERYQKHLELDVEFLRLKEVE